MDTHPLTRTEDAVVVVDAECRVLSCNNAAEKILREAAGPGETLRLESFLRPPFRERLADALQRVTKQGAGVVDLHLRIETGGGAQVLANGSLQPLLSGGRTPVGAVLTLQPVAATRLSPPTPPPSGPGAPQLQHYELLESLPEGVFTINTRWRIASFNKTAEEITGFQREEVVGRYCWEVFRSDLCQEGCPLRAALETGHTCIDQDVRIIKKDGRRHSILVNAGVLRDRNGEVAGAVETFRTLSCEIGVPRDEMRHFTFDRIIGKSAEMQRLFSMLPDIAASDTNVLICGESGTGKDLVARTLHRHSPRRDAPFVAVNCSALAESLLESELFGHERAAFTGAAEARPGRFELAAGGTLFLDEIGELRPELQIKLLRVLEQREFERVGGTRSIAMRARVISATNRDLKKALQAGAFREDFYYRLRTVPLTLPPLRQRREDIPLLVDHFLERLNRRNQKCVQGVEPAVMKFFIEYEWPGNVRELERTLEYAFVFVKGTVILRTHLPETEDFRGGETGEGRASAPGEPSSREAVVWALARSGGRRDEAAALLGMSRTTLWRRMKKWGLAS